MTRSAAIMTLACALALAACGKLGPPVRSAASPPGQEQQGGQEEQGGQEGPGQEDQEEEER